MKVLIVERDRMFAEALTASLDAERDIEVVGPVLSAADAMDSAERTRPDIVTTSYELPDGNGIELCTRLHEAVGDVHVIIVSGLISANIAARAIEAGCAGYVSKAGPMSDVARAIRAVAAGRVALASGAFDLVLEQLEPGTDPQRLDLSPIELDILKLFAEGLTNRLIGERLGLTERSVRNHVESTLKKLDSHSKLEGLATAVRRGIITLGTLAALA